MKSSDNSDFVDPSIKTEATVDSIVESFIKSLATAFEARNKVFEDERIREIKTRDQKKKAKNITPRVAKLGNFGAYLEDDLRANLKDSKQNELDAIAKNIPGLVNRVLEKDSPVRIIKEGSVVQNIRRIISDVIAKVYEPNNDKGFKRVVNSFILKPFGIAALIATRLIIMLPMKALDVIWTKTNVPDELRSDVLSFPNTLDQARSTGYVESQKSLIEPTKLVADFVKRASQDLVSGKSLDSVNMYPVVVDAALNKTQQEAVKADPLTVTPSAPEMPSKPTTVFVPAQSGIKSEVVNPLLSSSNVVDLKTGATVESTNFANKVNTPSSTFVGDKEASKAYNAEKNYNYNSKKSLAVVNIPQQGFLRI